ncbi:hypothetical protein EVAR_40568_1 [Eumeta japonica]|uniref:Uncharacterized protein n=1 Tax=Eumeta variegata TaxID=151549 RepID=A0A4C1VVD4_EUMVA|nr:hypothetical protein EVAR_40568_1 [Eumeta japonica]
MGERSPARDGKCALSPMAGENWKGVTPSDISLDCGFLVCFPHAVLQSFSDPLLASLRLRGRIVPILRPRSSESAAPIWGHVPDKHVSCNSETEVCRRRMTYGLPQGPRHNVSRYRTLPTIGTAQALTRIKKLGFKVAFEKSEALLFYCPRKAPPTEFSIMNNTGALPAPWIEIGCLSERGKRAGRRGMMDEEWATETLTHWMKLKLEAVTSRLYSVRA